MYYIANDFVNKLKFKVKMYILQMVLLTNPDTKLTIKLNKIELNWI